MSDKYQSGKYWEENATFHEEDSDFKFQNFMTLLLRNPRVNMSGIVDMGCGAGRIIWNFSERYKNITCKGIDLNKEMVAYAAQKYHNPNLFFDTDAETVKGDPSFNMVVLADVFEHIDDYLGFLKDINRNFSYQLFNIPLDLSVISLARNGPIKTRNAVSHLHYFYDKLILQILEENGFKIIDYLYADNVLFANKKKKGVARVLHTGKLLFGRLASLFLGKSKASLYLGGFL